MVARFAIPHYDMTTREFSQNNFKYCRLREYVALRLEGKEA